MSAHPAAPAASQDPAAFWNRRYAAPAYAYGTAPNAFFSQQLADLPTGRLLLPAEGEGRNAAHAARMGWQVAAFDLSEQGRRKALALAAAFGVADRLSYQVGSVQDMPLPPGQFDAAALVFAHFAPAIKSASHRKVAQALAAGGHLIFEGYAKSNLPRVRANPAIGGPQDEQALFSLDEIRADFIDGAGLEPLVLQETVVQLHEGQFHNGAASVIRFVGRKP